MEREERGRSLKEGKGRERVCEDEDVNLLVVRGRRWKSDGKGRKREFKGRGERENG